MAQTDFLINLFVSCSNYTSIMREIETAKIHAQLNYLTPKYKHTVRDIVLHVVLFGYACGAIL